MGQFYEVMLVVDGDLGEDAARSSIDNLLSLFNKAKNFKEEFTQKDPLAYPIKKKKFGHRFVLTFELDSPEPLSELKRLAPLNRDVLRYLVINLSKDKGWRDRNNPDKVKDFEIRQKKFRQYLEDKKNL